MFRFCDVQLQAKSRGQLKEHMERFFATQVAAGYVIRFLLCPLNLRFPSAFLPVGMVPSNLKYTTGDVNHFLAEIRSGLLAAGQHGEPLRL